MAAAKKAPAKKAAAKKATAKKAPVKKALGGSMIVAYQMCTEHKIRFPRGEGCPRCT